MVAEDGDAGIGIEQVSGHRGRLRPPGYTGATHGADSAESLSHERIATAAYYLWQQAGCPPGRAEEYWYKAVEQLKEQTGMQPEKE